MCAQSAQPSFSYEAASIRWFRSLSIHGCWRARWHSWNTRGCTLDCLCRPSGGAYRSVCSRSGCSDRLCHHHCTSYRASGVTKLSPSLQLNAHRISQEVYYYSTYSIWVICCHCHQKPAIAGRGSTWVRKLPTCGLRALRKSCSSFSNLCARYFYLCFLYLAWMCSRLYTLFSPDVLGNFWPSFVWWRPKFVVRRSKYRRQVPFRCSTRIYWSLFLVIPNRTALLLLM